MDKNINITLKVWRQKGPKEKGAFETYQLEDVSQGSSFLEMLDILNEKLVNEGKEPVVFDHDCREGICGMCSLYIDGHPHGPDTSITTCQLHMRKFNDAATITVEPWRSAGFPFTVLQYPLVPYAGHCILNDNIHLCSLHHQVTRQA